MLVEEFDICVSCQNQRIYLKRISLVSSKDISDFLFVVVVEILFCYGLSKQKSYLCLADVHHSNYKWWHHGHRHGRGSWIITAHTKSWISQPPLWPPAMWSHLQPVHKNPQELSFGKVEALWESDEISTERRETQRFALLSDPQERPTMTYTPSALTRRGRPWL